MLLTRHVLHEPAALVEVFAAIQDAKPIIPVCLMGHGYDFKDAQAHLSELETRLGPHKLAELRKGLCALSSGTPDAKHVSIGELQAALLATLPRIIAVNWEPQGGKHQLDSTVTNVLGAPQDTAAWDGTQKEGAPGDSGFATEHRGVGCHGAVHHCAGTIRLPRAAGQCRCCAAGVATIQATTAFRAISLRKRARDQPRPNGCCIAGCWRSGCALDAVATTGASCSIGV